MIATSAFGIGIDYAHVRQVICFGLPYSVEDYAQMMRRVGSDGRVCGGLNVIQSPPSPTPHHVTYIDPSSTLYDLM